MASATQPGTLYVVATPIGNLEDITLRAMRVLSETDVIAAEDTRHTRKLLSHFDIHTPMVSLHDYSTSKVVDGLVERLLAGESVAEVSDAGTPGVSDPGYALTAAAAAAGIPIVPIPGASALLAALVGSGLPMDCFRFVGFLPRQSKERRGALRDLASAAETLVFFEAPHRLRRMLADVADVLGPRPACAARELTKVHEEFIRAPLTGLAEMVAEPVRGEWTLVVGGSDAPAPLEEAVCWEQDLRSRLEAGESLRDATKAVVDAAGLPRKDIYAAALRLRDEIIAS